MPDFEQTRLLYGLLQDDQRVQSILREEETTSSFCDDPSFNHLLKRVQSDRRILDALFILSTRASNSVGTVSVPQMGELIRKKDWSQTAMGHPDTWHPDLMRVLTFMMAAETPMALYWENYGEVYAVAEPGFQRVFNGGSVYIENDLLPLGRNGFMEECYFTWSLGLLRLPDGSPGGVLNPAVETTKQVLALRRLNLLRELANKVSSLQTVAKCCETTSAIFNSNPADLPFSLIYVMEGKDCCDRCIFDLHGMSGLPTGHVAAPMRVEVHLCDAVSSSDGGDSNSCSSAWPFLETIVCRRCVEVSELSNKFGELSSHKWPEPVHMAVVLPITSSMDDEDLIGILVVGISPRLVFDDDYKAFVQLLACQLASSINTARSFEHERKRVEELAQLDHAKTVFFSNVSHELRTPLTLIMGPLEDCLANTLNPLLPEHSVSLSMVHRNALRLLKLVNSLLDFSSIEANHMQASYEPVDLSSFTADLASMFRATIEKAGLMLIVDTPPLCSMYVDKSMYEKIVFNLLSNAFKFTLRGSITVQTRYIAPSDASPSEYVDLIVTDTGMGIPDDQFTRIFERFHRVEAVHGRSHEGTGIGLTLSLELAKLHGGSINVVSQVGVGSTFTVRLPMGLAHLDPKQVSLRIKNEPTKSVKAGHMYVTEAERWLPSDTRDALPQQQRNTRTADLMAAPPSRILVVDDNSDMRMYIASLLAPYTQFEVVPLSSGAEALEEAMSSNPPHLIISDIMMPMIDGFRLIREVRANLALTHIPIILLSARAGEEAKVEGLASGADDYLVKPFNAKELLARVQNQLEVGRMRLHLEQQILDRTHKLQESEYKFRTLSELAPVGICQVDVEGMLIHANDKFLEMIDMPLLSSLGLGWMAALHKEDSAIIVEWTNQICYGKTLSRELKFVKSDGKIICVMVQAKAFKHDGKHQLIAAFIDISEHKALEHDRIEAIQRAEAEQRRRAEEAEQHRVQQEMFVDTICHEIRNPLSGIINNVDLLSASINYIQIAVKDLPLKAAVGEALFQQIKLNQESLDAILVCARHQQVVTNDVLYLSKLESGHVQLNIVPFNPHTTLKDVLQMFNAEMAMKGVQSEIILPERKMCVMGDPNRLYQIVSNLISNSIKFMATAITKCVVIKMEVLPPAPSTLPHHLTLQISVADTGIGMTAKEQANLFQRFSQANSNTHQYYGGFGLGLFISKELVNMMGGEIHAESEFGHGAKFVFTIEVEEVDEPNGFVGYTPAPPNLCVNTAPVETSVPPINSAPSHARRLLIVEDNLINVKVLKRQLENAGHSCLVARNGLEAFEISGRGLEQSPLRYAVDLIFMDMEMPVMGGLESTRKIRERERALGIDPIPIVALSGNARQKHIDALEAGMQHFIVKPYQKEEVLLILHELTTSSDKSLARS